jgi:hypothetical protein
MKEAGVAPPGVMPIQMPTSELRSEVTQYLRQFLPGLPDHAWG